MVLVDKLLAKLKDGGHRVLIFSQMVRCLDILEVTIYLLSCELFSLEFAQHGLVMGSSPQQNVTKLQIT